MRILVRLALLALVATAATPSKADCEQCATSNLVECQTIGSSVYCLYSDGSYTRADRIRSKS
jgi:hypothetical protein